jgi:hypothetical protein
VSGNGCCFVGGWIHVNRVGSAFAMNMAAVPP